jgi:mono/diheme cytochrome c family protein
MPSFGDVLEDDQIRKLIELEHALLEGREPPDAEIKAIFDEACAVCHGKGGRGDGDRVISTQPPPERFISAVQPPPADYTNAKLMNRFSDEFRFWLIKKGRIGVTEEMQFDTMKSYGNVLSDEEIWSVIRYIRETFIEVKDSQ